MVMFSLSPERYVEAEVVHIPTGELRGVSGINKLKMNSSNGRLVSYRSDLCYVSSSLVMYDSVLSMGTNVLVHQAPGTSGGEWDNICSWEFSNVGKINGRSLNSRVDITHFKSVGSMLYKSDADKIYWHGVCGLNERGLALYTNSLTYGEVHVKVTFTWADTGQVVNLPFYQGSADIDIWKTSSSPYKECFYFGNGFKSTYYTWAGAHLSIIGNGVFPSVAGQNKSGTDSWTLSGCIVPTTGGQFSFVYAGQGCAGDIQLFSDRTSDPDIQKAVDTTHSYYKGDTVSWNIDTKVKTFYVDMFSYYGLLEFTDTLPEGLDYTSCVVTKGGRDITQNCIITYNPDTREFKASIDPSVLANRSFYNGEAMRCTINSKVDSATGIINNTGVVNYDNVRYDTNQAQINVVHSITTEVEGPGTISDCITNIQSGSSKSVTYSPNANCYLSEIQIDGITMPNNQLINYLNEYTFNNITSNHKIKAIFKENPTLTVVKEATPDYLNVFGNGEYLFKITGVGRLGENYEYSRSIHNGQSFTIQVPVGKYKVKEIGLNRSRLQEIIPLANGNALGETNLERGNASFKFINSLTKYDDYGHNDVIINNIK